MLSGKKYKADVSRAQILDAAAGLFRQYGYGQVSLRVIAESAGIKSGSLHYYFASKETIVLEVLDLGLRWFIKKLKPLFVQCLNRRVRVNCYVLVF